VKVSGDSNEGILFVVSAPSGAGKSTVARRVIEAMPDLGFSVSYTTRALRPGEQDGRDYHFVERGQFKAMIEGDEFLEWASVFDHLYGTGVKVTRDILASGRSLLLDIDVQGARQVRERVDACVSVMLLPPDFPTLSARLRGRGSETPEALAGRLTQARNEVEQYESFDYLVVNEDLEETVGEVLAIVRAESRRTARSSGEVNRILATFPE